MFKKILNLLRGELPGEQGMDDPVAKEIAKHAESFDRHFEEMMSTNSGWRKRMQHANCAEKEKEQWEAKFRRHYREFTDSVRRPNSIYESDLWEERRNLFEKRKGDPEANWSVMQSHEQLQHARELERTAAQLRIDGEESRADDVMRMAIHIYRDQVGEGTCASMPYRRLAIIYRGREEYQAEINVLDRAIEVFRGSQRAGTRKKMSKFEKRREKAGELLQQEH